MHCASLPSPGFADFTIMTKCTIESIESGRCHSVYSEEISKNQLEIRMVVGGGGGGGDGGVIPSAPIPIYSRLLRRIFIDDESGLSSTSDICFMEKTRKLTKTG